MSGTISISIRHNFETAHRLPFLNGKCTNLHGHSWKTSLTFSAIQHEIGMDSQGISTEYGELKKVVRGWIDDKLDHGCMLGVHDPLLPVLLDLDSKVFVFGNVGFLHIAAEEEKGQPSYNVPAEDRNFPTMPWPTVEAVARMICEKIQALVDQAFNSTLWVGSVYVMETAVNSAVWTPEGRGNYRFDTEEASLQQQAPCDYDE